MDIAYPKKATLRNNVTVELRPLERSDEPKLFQFFKKLPHDAVEFLKDDVHDPEVARRFVKELDPERVWCLLAITEEGEVVANATLHVILRGWKRHIGEIRLVVDPRFQKQGLATQLIHDLVNEASLRSLRKLEAQVLVIQEGVTDAFKHLGFVEEARLKNHALDIDGREHDLLILTNTVDDLWKKMEDLILDMEVARAQEGY